MSFFGEQPDLIKAFILLCSDNFTFVNNWDDYRIPTSIMRLYSKRVPAKDAAKQFLKELRDKLLTNWIKGGERLKMCKHYVTIINAEV